MGAGTYGDMGDMRIYCRRNTAYSDKRSSSPVSDIRLVLRSQADNRLGRYDSDACILKCGRNALKSTYRFCYRYASRLCAGAVHEPVAHSRKDSFPVSDDNSDDTYTRYGAYSTFDNRRHFKRTNSDSCNTYLLSRIDKHSCRFQVGGKRTPRADEILRRKQVSALYKNAHPVCYVIFLHGA